MDHKNKEEWTVIGDSQPLWKAIQDNSLVLNNLYKLILKIEKRQDEQAESLKKLQETTYEIQDKMYQNLKNIDENIREIDNDIEDFEKEVENVKQQMTDTKTTLMENREIFTKVMEKFMKLETEEIKPKLEQITNNQQIAANALILPSYEKTVEQNRLWRLYSNHYRQNTTQNNTNILTQLSLSNNILKK